MFAVDFDILAGHIEVFTHRIELGFSVIRCGEFRAPLG